MVSNLRIGGLASGMDIDSIVEDLMEIHRIPVQRLEQEKQILEWKQEDYRKINTSLRSFRDIAFNMKLQSIYLAKKATSSDESIVEVSANSNAIEGTYSFAVKQLASGAYTSSSGAITVEDGDASSLAGQLGVSGPQELTIEYNGVQKTFAIDDPDETTIYDLVNEINTYEPPDDAEWNVRASYDANLDRFFLMTTETGEDQVITVYDNELSGKLKLTAGSDVEVKGTNAQYFLNTEDSSQYFESSTNSFTVNNITFDIKGVSSTDASGNGYKDQTVIVTADTDAVFDSIVTFINEYNNIIKTIGDKIHETRYSDYEPLTDEQREQLTDDQIDRWIEKARSGLLRNDSILSGIYTKMRMTMSAVVAGSGATYDRLADIGITTTADYMSGELVIDEEKLRKAVEEDPEGIMELFTYNPDTGDESQDYYRMGIARRLYMDVNNAMSSISTKAGSANDYSLVDNSLIGEEIDRIEEEIELKNERLQQLEDRYWSQFTAMEKAIQQMNQQSLWLSQQLGL